MFPRNLQKELRSEWIPKSQNLQYSQIHIYDPMSRDKIAAAATKLYARKILRLQSIQTRLLHLVSIYDATNSQYGTLCHMTNVPICFFCGTIGSIFVGTTGQIFRDPQFEILLFRSAEQNHERFHFEIYHVMDKTYSIAYQNDQQVAVPFIEKRADSNTGVCMLCQTCKVLLQDHEPRVVNDSKISHQGDWLHRLTDPVLQSAKKILTKFLPTDIASLVEDFRLQINDVVFWTFENLHKSAEGTHV